MQKYMYCSYADYINLHIIANMHKYNSVKSFIKVEQ